jgi:hypothetical protein
MVKYEEKYGSILNKNSASKHTEIHLMMTQQESKHVVFNTNIKHLNFCDDGYKYTVLFVIIFPLLSTAFTEWSASVV